MGKEKASPREESEREEGGEFLIACSMQKLSQQAIKNRSQGRPGNEARDL